MWGLLFDDDDEGPRRSHGGSLPGRKPNKNRNYQARYERLVAQYFADEPIYDEADFRCRFRMSKRLFQRVFDGVLVVDPGYFKQRQNCAKKMGIHPLLKIASALRILADAAPADAIDENMEMGESTIMQTFEHFLSAVDTAFGDNYLRSPTAEDVARLLANSNERGFVGMLFSLDCMHWVWQNCPASLAGQYQGKAHNPTIVLEACADSELWIWYASFGWPGSLNDLNILHRSDFFDRLLRGEAPAVAFTVNQNEYSMAYCLADGIYLDWPVFLKTIQQDEALRGKAGGLSKGRGAGVWCS